MIYDDSTPSLATGPLCMVHRSRMADPWKELQSLPWPIFYLSAYPLLVLRKTLHCFFSAQYITILVHDIGLSGVSHSLSRSALLPPSFSLGPRSPWRTLLLYYSKSYHEFKITKKRLRVPTRVRSYYRGRSYHYYYISVKLKLRKERKKRKGRRGPLAPLLAHDPSSSHCMVLAPHPPGRVAPVPALLTVLSPFSFY